MWMLNQLYVEGPQPGLTPSELAGELDRGLNDVSHRRVTVIDDATGRSLAGGMREQGYQDMALAVMLLDGQPPAAPGELVREVGEAEMAALEERILRDDPGMPDTDIPVVLDGHARIAAAVPTTMLAGTDAGEPVARTFVYADGRTAQVETVATVRAHRGRGIASAMVAYGGRRAVADGCDLVFLVCDAIAGPVALYSELGFRVAGRMWTFTRPA